MAAILCDEPVTTPRANAENRKRMARADLRKAENDLWDRLAGRAIARARQLAGWSLDRLALELGKDARQVSRWEKGDTPDHPQLDALFAIEGFREPLVIALAEQCCSAEIETTIRFRRRTA